VLLNAIQKKPLYKVGLYGGPGRGKTHVGATAPDPLILLFERHGFETVRTASKMQGRPMPPVLWIRSVKQLYAVQQILATAEEPIAAMMRDPDVVSEEEVMEAGLDREKLVEALPYTTPQTIVIDSLTEACELIAKVIDAHGGLETKDGLTYRKLRAWGPIADKCVATIRAFRDLPYHVLFLMLVDERNLGSDDEPDTHFRPALPGRTLWRPLTAAVNAMGVLQMKHGKTKDGALVTKRWVSFVTPPNVCSKLASPLRAKEPANAGAWFAALEHGVVNTSDPVEQLVEEAAPSGTSDEETKTAEESTDE